MPLFQSQTAKGKIATPNPDDAGAVYAHVSTFTFDAAFTAATDKLELGFLAAGLKVKSATIIGEGLGAITAKVGFMSGVATTNDVTRTVGNDFFATQSVNNAEGSITALVAKDIATSTADRGIGVELSGNVAAGAAKKISLVIEYYA